MKTAINKTLVEFVVEQIKDVGDISYKYDFRTLMLWRSKVN